MRIPSGKTDQSIYFVAVDATDLKTREAGLSGFTVYRSRNGAAEVQYTTPTVSEIDATNMPGVYALLIDEDTTIASGSDSEEYCVHITHASMAPVTRTIELYRRDTTSGQTIDVSSGGVEVGTFQTGAITSAAFASGAITATALAGDCITAAKLAADVTTELQSGLATAAALTTVETKIDTIDTNVDSILVDTGTDIPATLSTIAGYIDTEVAAIKTKTDQLTFTVANQVDANIQYVNDTEVTGDGQSGTEWGPA